MPKKTVAFPFELPKAPEPFFLEIDPTIAAIMNSGTVDEQNAIAAIAPHLTRRDETWGVKLPRKFGFNLPERTALIESQKMDRETTKASIKLFQKIARETEKTIEEIQAAAQAVETGESVEWFLPFAEEMMALGERMEQTPLPIIECTILMQRTVPSWTKSNTQALHPKILEKLFDFREEEQQPVGEAMGTTAPLESS